MSTCDGHHHEPDHDPTLASCCQRDLAQQAQNRKHLQRLQATDCSTVRTDMTAAVLATPTESDPKPHSQEFSDLPSEDEADELQHFRLMRLQQLKQEMQQKASLQSQGHGTLTEVSQAFLQALVSSEKLLLCHMFMNGIQACEQLNEHLNMVAHEHLHARFVYVRATKSTATVSALGAVPIPGLVVYHKGKVSGAAPVHVFGDAMSVQEDQVDKWLRTQLVDSNGSLTLNVTDESDEDMVDDDKPCSLCGRRYQHEHIRSMYQGPSDSDDSEDSS